MFDPGPSLSASLAEGRKSVYSTKGQLYIFWSLPPPYAQEPLFIRHHISYCFLNLFFITEEAYLSAFKCTLVHFMMGEGRDRERRGGTEKRRKEEGRMSSFDTLILLQPQPYLSTSFLSQSFWKLPKKSLSIHYSIFLYSSALCS